MKNKILTILSLSLLYFCISCQKDDGEANLETSDELQAVISKNLSLQEIPHFNEVSTTIDKLTARLNQEDEGLQKTLDADSISIITDAIIYMTYADTHTYTFKMIRDNPAYYIENIVLHYNLDTESYDEYLLQYDITAEEYLEIANGADLSEDTITYITELASGTLGSALNKNSCTISCQTIVLRCTAGGNHYPGDPECCVTRGTCSADQGGAIFNSCTSTCTYEAPVETIDDGDTSGGGGSNSTVVSRPNPREACYQDGNIGVSGDEGSCLMTVYEDCIDSGNSPEVCECEAAGNDIEDCVFESWLNSLSEEEIEEYNWYEDQSSNETLANELMNCFNNIDEISSSATYSLTIYVEQPVPNSDAPNNGTDPGHTFISMSINDPINSDNNITQTLGFYPRNSVNPLTGNNVDDGLFTDNSGHNYHVSATITLDNSSFYQIVNQIDTLGNSIPQYDLENYNCTDFGINMANSAGMNLPDTQGFWGVNVPALGFVELGSGSNPGALGQDIRNLNNQGVSVNTTSGSAAPTGNGPCN